MRDDVGGVKKFYGVNTPPVGGVYNSLDAVSLTCALALSAKASSVSAPAVLRSPSFDCRSAQLASSFRRSMLKTELYDIAYSEHSD